MMFLYAEMCKQTIFLFVVTQVFIFLARLAYFNVLTVYSYCQLIGDMFAIITVLQFPPNESLRSRVSLESRYGTYVPFLFLSPSALMQFARARRDVLILAPSRRRMPRFQVTVPLYEPARSISESFPQSMLTSVFFILSLLVTIT